MSMPSLIISESNALNDSSKEKCSASSNYKKNLKSSNRGSGAQCCKKVVTESVSAPSVNSEPDGRQQSFHVWRRSERRNRKSEKGGEELTRGMKCKENNAHSNVIERSDLEKRHSDDKERCDEPVSTSVLVCTKIKDSEDVEIESLENEKDENCSLKSFLKNDTLVCNHLCDPSIPEISETSDVEDDENRETSTLKHQVNLAPETGEGEIADSDQQADPEAW